MKVVHRISTGQFEYVELITENVNMEANPKEIRDFHEKVKDAFRHKLVVVGIPDKEYNQFIDAMLLGEPNHIDVWEKLSDKQKDAAQVIKRSLKRLEAKSQQ